jgi:hypothetical protein
MSQIQKGETFVDGQVVTFDMLNDLVDSAQLLPPCINGQTEKLQGTFQGTEEVLIYDPVAGALRKAQVQNLIRSGVAIETNYIEGAQYGGQTGTLSIVSSEGFALNNGDTSNANSGVNISSTGGNLNLTATASGYGHGNGKITLSSGLGGVEFVTSGIGKFVFNSSSSIKLPVGTTAQRPATPVAGDFRYNSTLSDAEYYNGSAWANLISLTKVAVIDLVLPENNQYTYPTQNAWASVPLNRLTETDTFVVNSSAFTGSGTSNSNITLPAGTYSVATNVTIQSLGGAGSITCRVFNNTTSTEIRRGNTTYCSSYSNGTSTCYAAFKVAVETTINIQYYAYIAASPSSIEGPGAEVHFSTMITKFA